MVLFIHLLIGNVLFFTFLVKRKKVLSYYEKCNKILKLNALLKGNETPSINPKAADTPTYAKGPSSSFLGILAFYLQFVLLAWMLFLTTFIAAEIVIRINPKIKEYL